MPKVFFSIIIPTFNRAQLLKTTLQSLISQTFANFEIIVVDDGGSDNTGEVIKAFGDNRIKYFWKENAERGAARNYGANIAKGEYLNFFDSDDQAYENHLQTAFNYLTKNPNSVIIHNSFDWRYQNSGNGVRPVINKGILNNKVFKSNILSPNGVFVRKSEFDIIKYSEDRNLSGTEDWLLWLQFGCRYPICGLAEVTTSMIQHTQRSMVTASGDSTLKRTNALAINMKHDSILVNSEYHIYKYAMAEMYYLTSLYYSIEGKRAECLKYFSKAFKSFPLIIFRKRTMAIMKYYLKSYIN